MSNENLYKHIKKNVVFSLKLNKYIWYSDFIQYFYIISKYLPLFLICHDVELHKGQNVNEILSYLTIKRYLKNYSNSYIPDISSILIICLLILFYSILDKLYKIIDNKKETVYTSIRSNSKIYYKVFSYMT